MYRSRNTKPRPNDSNYTEGCQVYEAGLFTDAMAEEDEDEGEEDGWVDCYFGDGEGFERLHSGGVLEEV